MSLLPNGDYLDLLQRLENLKQQIYIAYTAYQKDELSLDDVFTISTQFDKLNAIYKNLLWKPQVVEFLQDEYLNHNGHIESDSDKNDDLTHEVVYCQNNQAKNQQPIILK